jgi:4-amino-4-deoxy-L-arabinose transferase-like glycosyltransferase
VRRQNGGLILAILFALVMIFARLGDLPLRDPDEGRNAQVAREMLASGAWLTPTYNGWVYLDKPSFFFKSVALCFEAFGESEFTARLPSALFASGLLLMVYRFCRREYGQQTAALAVIIVTTMPLFVALARHVIFDMTLAFFVCGAIFAGYFAEQDESPKRRKWYALGAFLSGCGTLVKGPVGFIVPVLVLALFNMVERRSGWWKRQFHPLNIAVFFATTLPWFIGISLSHPDFPHYGLVEESVKRFGTNTFSRSAPFYYYALVVLGGAFAWSVLLPEATIAAWRARSRWSRADRLLIIWTVAVVIFFSISRSKLPHYILTAMVSVGILIARLFASALQRPENAANRIIMRGLVFVAALSLAAAAFLVINILDPNAHRTIFKIRSREFEHFTLAFRSGAWAMAVIATFAIAARISRNIQVALAAFLVLPLFFITFGFTGLAQYSEASSARELARKLSAMLPNVEIACQESWPFGLDYYLHSKVTLITSSGSEISPYIVYSLRNATNWPPNLVRLSQEEEWLASQKRPVYLVGSDRAKRALQRIADQRHASIDHLTPGWWGLNLRPDY